MNLLKKAKVNAYEIGEVSEERNLVITKGDSEYLLFIDHLRDVWFKSSYLLDRKQSGNKWAKERYNNYKKQAIRYKLPKGFNGKLEDLGLTADRVGRSGVKAAIIREKGINGDREMAY